MAESVPKATLVVAEHHSWFNLGRVAEGLTYILPTIRLTLEARNKAWPKVKRLLDLCDEKFKQILELISESDFTTESFKRLDPLMDTLMEWVGALRFIMSDPAMTKRKAEAKLRGVAGVKL